MPPSRSERYNAKARRSVAGGSSHKKHKKKKPETVAMDSVDTNAEILEHKSREEKDTNRRETLRQEVNIKNVRRNILNETVASVVNAGCIG
jgi:ATP-dependent RNA helicase DHX37/DHR1